MISRHDCTVSAHRYWVSRRLLAFTLLGIDATSSFTERWGTLEPICTEDILISASLFSLDEPACLQNTIRRHSIYARRRRSRFILLCYYSFTGIIVMGLFHSLLYFTYGTASLNICENFILCIYFRDWHYFDFHNRLRGCGDTGFAILIVHLPLDCGELSLRRVDDSLGRFFSHDRADTGHIQGFRWIHYDYAWLPFGQAFLLCRSFLSQCFLCSAQLRGSSLWFSSFLSLALFQDAIGISGCSFFI